MVAVRFPSLTPAGQCSRRVAQARSALKHAIEQTQRQLTGRREGRCWWLDGDPQCQWAVDTLAFLSAAKGKGGCHLSGGLSAIRPIRETLTVPAAPGWLPSDPRTIESDRRSQTKLHLREAAGATQDSTSLRGHDPGGGRGTRPAPGHSLSRGTGLLTNCG